MHSFQWNVTSNYSQKICLLAGFFKSITKKMQLGKMASLGTMLVDIVFLGADWQYPQKTEIRKTVNVSFCGTQNFNCAH